MSAPTKKVARHEDMEKGDNSSDSEYDSDPAEEGYTGGEEIQVTFEGRVPSDPDFHGIKQLLKQLFLKAHINLSELTEILIGQSNIGNDLNKVQQTRIWKMMSLMLMMCLV
uniref:Protein BCCIP homolog n=1 Tax=Cacopsylla melanoneura TaxID=428564 RepID=A0A8D8W6E0_9HEMI